jgi:squalene-hopene/tetraprenyl-beta-curcumene cyclase
MLTENAVSPVTDVDFNLEYRHASKLDKAISLASTQLLSLQDSSGFWVFELEADCTIPAEQSKPPSGAWR